MGPFVFLYHGRLLSVMSGCLLCRFFHACMELTLVGFVFSLIFRCFALRRFMVRR